MRTTNQGSLLLVLLLLAGCGATRGQADTGNEVAVPTDAALEAELACRNVEVRDDDGGRVIELELVNTGPSTRRFLYTFDWYDRTGTLIDAPEVTWTKAKLAPGRSKDIRLIPPSPAADSWCLRAVESLPD